MAIYVDDCLTIEPEKAIDEVIESLVAYGFGLEVENKLTDYLSCKIVQVDQSKGCSK